MTNEEAYFLSGTFGMLIHELIKLKSLKDKAAAINMPFVWKKYFISEWPIMASSLISVLALILMVPDLTHFSGFSNVLRILSVFVGYVGGQAIQGLFYLIGVGTNSKILEITKEKINEKDNNPSPTDNTSQ